MAARPNSQRTLEYGRRLAANHLERLDDMMDMTARAIDENRLLSPEDVSGYKECLRAGKKQRTQFLKILDIEVPEVDTSTVRRKRGRPSNEELEALELARGGNPKAKAKAPAKKRARARKAAPVAAAEETPAPKRKRGRPKGSKNAPKAAAKAAAVETPVKAKRGRPKGSKNKPKTNGVSASNGAAKPAKRKRGRPKGSKNKPKTEAVAA